jgi:hypothetical protein
MKGVMKGQTDRHRRVDQSTSHSWTLLARSLKMMSKYVQQMLLHREYD